MRRVILLGLLAACGGDGPADPGPQGDATAHVTHYDYQFDIATRAARAKVTAVLDTPGNCIVLGLRQSVGAVTLTVDGAPAAAGTSFTETSAHVCSVHGHAAGEEMIIEADLVVPLATLSASQVGYSVTNDAQGNPFHYLVSWVDGCDRFGPCDARPDQFARYAFTVTHPATLDVRCSGTITEVSEIETRCVFDHEGGPTYSTFGIAAYPAWSQIDKGMWGSARVTLYDRTQTTIDAVIDPAYHAGFMSFMESTFGPYPYGDELRVLTAPTYWSGFEHPGNIILDDLLARSPSSYLHPVAHVLDHEIAHQWAGDETTLATTHDFVWKEAMAEYLTYVYEETADVPAAQATVNAWKSFSVGAKYFPVPGEKPALFDYYGDVYGPGPMILFRQIERLSSRAQVITALQSVLGQPRSLSVAEVLAALEASTGLDLDDYAAAWIYGTGTPEWPRVTLTYTPGATTSTLRVVQIAGASRRCKFSVGLDNTSTGDRVMVTVDTFRNGIDQTISVPTPAFAVTSIELDPLRECIVLPASAQGPVRRAHPWLSTRAGRERGMLPRE
ncbi:MAG: hypothetical protein H0T89_08370 [Deltaproteobacteria bacterium]|nr:hypothetical protein [Deltaproteobacteria bacterium]MDQ3296491.1 hypothetical protein [Myxococcota bacterium]